MDNTKAVLSVLFLAMIASGCIDGGESEGQGSVTVKELAVTPSEIYSGQTVNARMEVQNTGVLPSEVEVGERGEEILKNYCVDIFDNTEEFSAVTTAVSETRPKYNLTPGESLRVNWKLKQEGSVPLYGYKCDLRFEVPFNYSVSSFRQVQLKQNREVEGTSNLQYKSSSGPLRLSIDTVPGSTGKKHTFIADGDEQRKIEILLQMVNEGSEKGYKKGVVDIDEGSLSIEATEPLMLAEKMDSSGSWSLKEGRKYLSGSNCDSYEGRDTCVNNDCNWLSGQNQCAPSQDSSQSPEAETRCEGIEGELTLYEGKSTIIRCEVPVPDNLGSPGKISEISANINYTYVKDAGDRRVEVKSRE